MLIRRRTQPRGRGRFLLLLLGVLAILAASCGSDSGGSTASSDGGASPAADCAKPATGEPIKIGDVTSYSGTNIFPESATISRLVFDRYNCEGGVNGRPIELVKSDAQDTAEGASASAKTLVEQDKVLGFCCGGSIVDCTTNAGYYQENDFYPLMGVAACAESTNVSPINTGPFLPTLHMLDFFKYDLKKTKFCFAGQNVPLTEVFKSVFIPLWEKDSGDKVELVIAEVGEDLTPSVTKLAADGCEAVLVAFTEPGYQSFFQIADAQGLKDKMVFGMLTSGYSLNLKKAAGDTLEGVYVNSEFEPYTGDKAKFSDGVNDYIALAEGAGEPLTSFGESGYIAANIVIKALESVTGDFTKESVNKAFRDVTYETPMLGGPFKAIGFVGGKQPNLTSQILQVKDGQFTSVTDWRIFPNPDK
jgi:branched-chain amino acid transport system substrate-binding protein